MADPQGTRVTVGVTLTEIVSIDARQDEWVTVQIQNLDATQTLRGDVERRLSPAAEWSPTSVREFRAVGPVGAVDADGLPADSATADMDTSSAGYHRVVGRMDGAGGDVMVYVRKGARR